MLLIALFIGTAALVGGASGALAAWLFLRRRQREPQARSVPLADPARVKEIERAAEIWAHSHGRPEATGLMADKLHVLHRIGRNRGWWRWLSS